LGFDFPYYPVFGCLLLLVAGLHAVTRVGSARAAGPALALVAATAFGFLLNIAPNVAYRLKHGPNPADDQAAKRSWLDTEILGLKLTSMLLPAQGHPVEALSKLEASYTALTVTNRDGTNCLPLGLAGALGFLALMVRLVGGFRDRRPDDFLGALAGMTAAALLVGTVSGLGVIVSLLFGGMIRSYDRIVVFIAFFALLAVAVGLRRMLAAGRRGWGLGAARLGGLSGLAVGL